MHWYGKAEVARQRKVGHVTVTAATPAEARARLALIDPAAAQSLEATAAAEAPSAASASSDPPKVRHAAVYPNHHVTCCGSKACLCAIVSRM